MKTKHHMAPARIVILSFIGMILIGTFLLMLPISSKSQTFTPFINALFTSTSASCVTGLAVYDTYTHWSLFGQMVILILIQIGGLGIITMAMFLATIAGKKIGLRSRTIMKESIDAPQAGGMVRITKFIFKSAFVIEGIGAVLLSFRFIPEYGLIEGIWMSIFHSISAFCNAGFDLMGKKEAFSSLTYYANDPLVLSVISTLIIIGGLGFFVWEDILKNKWKFKRYRLQTKIVIVTSFILIVIPALYLFFYEFSQPKWNMTLQERILASLFESITPRTAGFNCVDYQLLSVSSFPIYMTLMLIGGSSGSTAGGFKTTTLAVLVMTLVSIFRKKDSVEIFNRRLSSDNIHHTIAVLGLYLGLFLLGSILISMFDMVSLQDSCFEIASALGTVGLTTGITRSLSTASHLILIILMYLGRVGSLTMLFALNANKPLVYSKVPQESISIG